MVEARVAGHRVRLGELSSSRAPDSLDAGAMVVRLHADGEDAFYSFGTRSDGRAPDENTLGIETPSEASRGETISVRYFYRVEEQPEREWRTFVHADGKKERVRGDHALPIPWRLIAPQRILVDRVTLKIPADLKSDELRLFHGFSLNERRMPLPDQEDNRFAGPILRIRKTRPKARSPK